MNELEVRDPAEYQHTQVAMRAVALDAAAQPANTVRPRVTDNVSVAGTETWEWPVRFIPRVEISIGAIDNFVNAVVETVKEHEEDGTTHSLVRPLSLNAKGIAIKPLTSLYEMLKGISETNYVYLAADDAQINARSEKLLCNIQKQLLKDFQGAAFEVPDKAYAIARHDLFTTSVAMAYNVTQTAGHKTVNDVELIVSVYIHAAGLTSDTAKVSDVSASYAKVVRNLMKNTGVETSLDVVFDVSNFKKRPNLLELFSALCADDVSTNVVSVVNAEHLPAGANVSVGINLNKSKAS